MTAIGAERMILSGDSAGGGIAAGLAALAAQDNERLAGLALLSPWLDLTVSSASYMENSESDPLFSAEAAHEAAALYLQGVSPSDRVASPLFGSVEGYPPTLINVGAGEVLKDDAQRFYTKLKSAGITVQLDQVEGMEHVAVTRDHSLTGAAHTFDTLAIFVNRLLSED
jgi:acetyl esterase/lipase